MTNYRFPKEIPDFVHCFLGENNGFYMKQYTNHLHFKLMVATAFAILCENEHCCFGALRN